MSHKSIHLIVKNDTNSDHQIINFPNFDLSMRIRRFQPAPTLGPTPTEWRSALADTYPFVMTIQVYNIYYMKNIHNPYDKFGKKKNLWHTSASPWMNLIANTIIVLYGIKNARTKKQDPLRKMDPPSILFKTLDK